MLSSFRAKSKQSIFPLFIFLMGVVFIVETIFLFKLSSPTGDLGTMMTHEHHEHQESQEPQ